MRISCEPLPPWDMWSAEALECLSSKPEAHPRRATPTLRTPPAFPTRTAPPPTATTTMPKPAVGLPKREQSRTRSPVWSLAMSVANIHPAVDAQFFDGDRIAAGNAYLARPTLQGCESERPLREWLDPSATERSVCPPAEQAEASTLAELPAPDAAGDPGRS